MVNENGLAEIARPLILLGNTDQPLKAVENQRVNNRRCCGTRRLGTGGGAVGPPNSRSKKFGPEE
jgi:hypothetical protein